MLLFFRIIKAPMDTGTGAMIADPLYNLDDDQFANERFPWQEVVFDTFTAGTATRSLIRVKATVNQWLEPNEALFFLTQNNSGGSNTMQIRPWLRTLMRADS